MNSDLILAVFISSGAGWYAGHYFERKKAMTFIKHVAGQATQATTCMANAAMEVLKAKLPETDAEEIAGMLMAKCKEMGMDMVAITRKQALKAGLIHDSNNQAE